MAFDIHTQNVGGVCLHFGFATGQFDAASFSATSHLHLCFHHNRVTNTLGNCNGFIDRVCNIACRYGDAKLGKVLLALIFKEVHYVVAFSRLSSATSSHSAIVFNDEPGPKISLTPCCFNAAASASGMTPPPKINT